MISIEQARAKAQQRLRSRSSEWAVLAGWPAGAAAFEMVLHPPSESEVLADQRAAEAWVASWAGSAASNAVEWVERSWRSLGRQRVPARLVLNDPVAVAGFVGGSSATDFTTLRRRVAAIRRRLGVDDAVDAVVRRHAADLVAFDEVRFDQVVDAAGWIAQNPVEGLRPRQLPIRGVDTKWFASNRAIVGALVAAVAGRDDLGVVTTDPLVRVRVLDPSLTIGGLDDLAAPVDDLATLSLRPRLVIIAENLETVLSMPLLDGAVAVHGAGYAVNAVVKIPWILGAPVLYWGDLDSNGFAILHRLRSWHPHVESVLMDRDTLEAHRDLWVAEPKPARGVFPTLTQTELHALAAVRDFGDVRLEQERIPWDSAWASIEARAAELPTGLAAETTARP